jgi:hypothetical protein
MMPGMPTPLPPDHPTRVLHRRNVARNASLLLAGVNVPYTLLIVSNNAAGRSPGWFNLACFVPLVVTLPAAYRAFTIFRGVQMSAGVADGTFAQWLDAAVLTFAVLVCAHIFFFGACFTSGLAGLACFSGTSGGPVAVVGAFLIGMFVASYVTYRVTGWYLDRA